MAVNEESGTALDVVLEAALVVLLQHLLLYVVRQNRLAQLDLLVPMVAVQLRLELAVHLHGCRVLSRSRPLRSPLPLDLVEVEQLLVDVRRPYLSKLRLLVILALGHDITEHRGVGRVNGTNSSLAPGAATQLIVAEKKTV